MSSRKLAVISLMKKSILDLIEGNLKSITDLLSFSLGLVSD